jgi:hypothetical protein
MKRLIKLGFITIAAIVVVFSAWYWGGEAYEKKFKRGRTGS